MKDETIKKIEYTAKETFQEYLMARCMEDTHALDDMLPDVYNDWITSQDVEDIIEYAEKWRNITPTVSKVEEVEELKKTEIFERIYDNPKREDGTEKPNRSLGKFYLLDGDMNDYSYEVYVKDLQGVAYKLIGKEVSGFYDKGEGGTKHTLIRLDELPEVKNYIKYVTSQHDRDIADKAVNGFAKYVDEAISVDIPNNHMRGWAKKYINHQSSKEDSTKSESNEGEVK